MKRRFLFPIFVLMPLTACSLSNINVVRAITRTENEVVKIGDVITVEPRSLVHDGESKVVNGQIIYCYYAWSVSSYLSRFLWSRRS